MKKHPSSGRNTLLWSVIMSAPGPLILGIGLMSGRSATQIADFVRRSAELLAIIMAYVSYLLSTKAGETNHTRKERLERSSNLFVGAMMCLAGALMLALALFSPPSDKGNVIPSLIVAFLGLVANSIFWRKYVRLNLREANPILAVQVRLYRAKSLVDACVCSALASVALAPLSLFAYYFDRIGSAVVAGYLLYCGGKTLRERLT